jgi:hypothetical protein
LRAFRGLSLGHHRRRPGLGIGLSANDFVVVRDFLIDRKGLSRRQFFRFSIDQFLDLFRLAKQFLVDLG